MKRILKKPENWCKKEMCCSRNRVRYCTLPRLNKMWILLWTFLIRIHPLGLIFLWPHMKCLRIVLHKNVRHLAAWASTILEYGTCYQLGKMFFNEMHAYYANFIVKRGTVSHFPILHDRVCITYIPCACSCFCNASKQRKPYLRHVLAVQYSTIQYSL